MVILIVLVLHILNIWYLLSLLLILHVIEGPLSGHIPLYRSAKPTIQSGDLLLQVWLIMGYSCSNRSGFYRCHNMFINCTYKRHSLCWTLISSGYNTMTSLVTLTIKYYHIQYMVLSSVNIILGHIILGQGGGSPPT